MQSIQFNKVAYVCLLIIVLCVSVGCSQSNETSGDELKLLQEEYVNLDEEKNQSSDASQSNDESQSSSESKSSNTSQSSNANQSSGENEIQEPTQQGVISVYICGAVKSPGVYELPELSRIYQAIDKAGGMTEEAMETYLNLAEQVEDGQKIYVPTKEEVELGEVGSIENHTNSDSKETTGQSGKVNINTASKEELMTLTGVGEAKADSIIEYREKVGAFQEPSDIQNISGIKGGVYSKIADEIVTR